MPTGYTADIGKGIDFRTFIWTCARAFGALVLMRDDPMTAPIPEEFTPSDYHLKKMEAARAEIAKFEGMSEAVAGAEAKEAFERQERWNAEQKQEKADLKAKYLAMLEQAQAWTPPTPDHQSLKEFMVQQITDSIKFDCGEFDSPGKLLLPEEFRSTGLFLARQNLAYHEREHQNEIARCNERNAWIKALRESVPA